MLTVDDVNKMTAEQLYALEVAWTFEVPCQGCQTQMPPPHLPGIWVFRRGYFNCSDTQRETVERCNHCERYATHSAAYAALCQLDPQLASTLTVSPNPELYAKEEPS